MIFMRCREKAGSIKKIRLLLAKLSRLPFVKGGLKHIS